MFMLKHMILVKKLSTNQEKKVTLNEVLSSPDVTLRGDPVYGVYCPGESRIGPERFGHE